MKFNFRLIHFHHKVNSNQIEQGFTLVELIVITVIITALSAIAIPTMLSQGTKARQTEAKTTVSTMCKNQQIHYMENGYFSATIGALNIGIKEETQNYLYSIIMDSPNHAMNMARAKEDVLKSYICTAYAEPPIAGELNSQASTFICEAMLNDSDPINVIDPAQCPENFALMTR